VPLQTLDASDDHRCGTKERGYHSLIRDVSRAELFDRCVSHSHSEHCRHDKWDRRRIGSSVGRVPALPHRGSRY